jgi:myo-inositol-1-phosphate synthase
VLVSNYDYRRNVVTFDSDNVATITPCEHEYEFRTEMTPGKTGLLLVGLGGNNGSTLVGGLLANREKLRWRTKEGEHQSNWKGSLTQATTVYVGATADGKEVHAPMSELVPMLRPDDIVVSGWDINGAALDVAMERAGVFDVDLQRQLAPMMAQVKPMPSIYYPDFIAANQADRADNLKKSNGKKQADLDAIRADIRKFKKDNKLDKVIVLWTANTERFCDVEAGLNMTAEEVLASIKASKDEVSPSQVFAAASLLENCAFINGSPQNTLVPGIMELAKRQGQFVGGDDFKSGQTKLKSVLMDFLVSAGLKVESIVSYNHLGNNDGKNLSSAKQFRSKEISKSNVVDDMVAANRILYQGDDHPDHCVVIKYVPHVGDSKRAMDEYTSSIFMDGKNTLVIHNTCEDSLLATPIILDLVILTELFQRVQYRDAKAPSSPLKQFNHVLSILSFLLKAPVVNDGEPVVNALTKQQRAITNTLCALVGLPPDSDMLLEHRTVPPQSESVADSRKRRRA